MRQGSTTAMSLTVPESLDLMNAAAIYVTVAQGKKIVTKKSGDPGVTVDHHVIHVKMTQQETLSFDVGVVEIQLRWLMPDGSAEATEIARVNNKGVLLKEVIS